VAGERGGRLWPAVVRGRNAPFSDQILNVLVKVNDNYPPVTTAHFERGQFPFADSLSNGADSDFEVLGGLSGSQGLMLGVGFKGFGQLASFDQCHRSKEKAPGRVRRRHVDLQIGTSLSCYRVFGREHAGIVCGPKIQPEAYRFIMSINK